jgi:dephospho-CoA kinase
MLKIGLTGGIGTGKTYLSTHFRDMGIPVYYADDEAKKLYRQPAFLADMRKEFQEESLWLPDGNLNMQQLSQSFENEDFLQRLSRFVHPYVMRDFERWAEEQHTQSVMMESAILFEYGLDRYFDKIIVADASEALRIKRIQMRNPQLTEDEIRQRMSRQMPQEEKCKRADLVVCTGETYQEMVGDFR